MTVNDFGDKLGPQGALGETQHSKCNESWQLLTGAFIVVIGMFLLFPTQKTL